MKNPRSTDEVDEKCTAVPVRYLQETAIGNRHIKLYDCLLVIIEWCIAIRHQCSTDLRKGETLFADHFNSKFYNF